MPQFTRECPSQSVLITEKGEVLEFTDESSESESSSSSDSFSDSEPESPVGITGRIAAQRGFQHCRNPSTEWHRNLIPVSTSFLVDETPTGRHFLWWYGPRGYNKEYNRHRVRIIWCFYMQVFLL